MGSRLQHLAVHHHHRQNDIESDKAGKHSRHISDNMSAGGSEDGCCDERHGCHAKEKELGFVAWCACGEVVELEFEHRHLAHHEQAEHEDERKEERSVEHRRVEVFGAARDECRPKERTGRCGQSDESVVLRRVDVELGQPQGCESGHEECSERHHLEPERRIHGLWIVHRGEEGENHGCRRQSERDDVGQRVELHTHRSGNTEQTSHKSVEKVEHGTEDDEQECRHELPVKTSTCCNTSADEIATCQRVWNMFFHIVSIDANCLSLILNDDYGWILNSTLFEPCDHSLVAHGLLVKLHTNLRAERQIDVNPGTKLDESHVVVDEAFLTFLSVCDNPPRHRTCNLACHHLLALRPF